MSRVKKCLVWDLDDTLWDGVLLEESVRPRQAVVNAIAELDRRGILHSIASRGDADLALAALGKFHLDRFFLVPQINWLAKSQNIHTISTRLQVSLDAIAFVDDDPFEREQVTCILPGVLTIPSERAEELPGWPDFSPGEITRESGLRRSMYQAQIRRDTAERDFPSREEFLLSCRMQLVVRPMSCDDLSRVLELMTRTHQLNSTGLIWDRPALVEAFQGHHSELNVTVAELRDRFGWYGIIGTAIAASTDASWRLKYLAVSCRVMGRGIERALLATLVRGALRQGYASPQAEFRDTGRNRMMRALFQMMGFTADGKPGDAGALLFSLRPEWLPDIPRWVEVL